MATLLSLPWEQRPRSSCVLPGVLSYRQGSPWWPLFSATKFRGCLLGNSRYTNAKSRGLQERSPRRAVRARQPPWAQTEGSVPASSREPGGGQMPESQAVPGSLKALICGRLPNDSWACTALAGHAAFHLYSVRVRDDCGHFPKASPAPRPGPAWKGRAVFVFAGPVHWLTLWSVLVRERVGKCVLSERACVSRTSPASSGVGVSQGRRRGLRLLSANAVFVPVWGRVCFWPGVWRFTCAGMPSVGSKPPTARGLPCSSRGGGPPSLLGSVSHVVFVGCFRAPALRGSAFSLTDLSSDLVGCFSSSCFLEALPAFCRFCGGSAGPCAETSLL